MSKTIDERVVSMRFDNSKFEKNVSTTMSTIDKLKAKLNFKDASKSFDNISKAASNVNIGDLGSAVEKVQVKFSALQVAGVTALANITNSAVDAGKKLIKSLSVDQISSGWTKYGQKTTAVATLQAQGFSLKEINDQLDRLNWFTDETSYNFTDMVENIAKFTATGKGLTDSVNAMEGIATWAALSGQNAQTASRAMYQLSQALGSGMMRKEDYKSIQNASMDTVEFRQKALDAAVALKTLKKNADGTYASLMSSSKNGSASFTISQFADTLTEGQWFTSDVMMKVFGDYSKAVDEIYKITEEKGMLASEVIDEIHDKAEKEGISTNEAIKKLGYNFDEFSLKAFEAGQKARTFNDAIDSVKDAVSTGWMKTFEIIFGDAEKATELWTDLANILWDLFAGGAESRNELLEQAFGNPFQGLLDKLEETNVGKFAKKVESMSMTLESYQKVVNDIWRGDYKNQPYRYGLLEEAGYDNPKMIQSLVNKGYKYKLTIDDINEAEKKYGKTSLKTGETVKKTSKSVEETAKSFEKMSDKQLKNKGFTEEEIKMLRQLQEESEKTGKSVNELIEEMSKADGRSLLFGGFKNISKGLMKAINAVKKAWSDIFPPVTSLQIYNALKSFNELTKKLVLNKEQVKELQRTFKGLFAILDIVSTLTAGPLKIAFKVIKGILGAFNIDVLEMTAKIGDAIVKFDEWLKSALDFEKIFKKIAPTIVSWVETIKDNFSKLSIDIAPRFTSFTENIGNNLKTFADRVKDLARSFKESDFYKAGQRLINGIIRGIKSKVSEIWKSIISVFEKITGISNLENAGENVVLGFIQGIKNGSISVWNCIVNLATGIINRFCDVLGIHSPSRIFEWIGKMCAKGFQKGIELILKVINWVINGVKKIIPKMKSVFDNLASKIMDTFDNIFGKPAEKVAEETPKQFKTAGKSSMESFRDGVKEKASAALESVKMAFGKIKEFLSNLNWDSIFAGGMSVGTLIITKELTDVLKTLTGPIDGVSSVLDGVGKVLKKSASGVKKVLKSTAKLIKSFSRTLNAVAFKESAKGLKDVAIAIAILVASLIALSKLANQDTIYESLGIIASLAGILFVLSLALSLMSKSGATIKKGEIQINDVRASLLGIAASLLIVAVAIRAIGTMDYDQYKQGMIGITVIVGEMLLLMVLMGKFVKGKTAQNADKIGLLMVKLAAAFRVMASVVKMLGEMPLSEIIQGGIAIAAFVGITVLLSKISGKSGNKHMDKMGSMLLKIAGALALMVIVVKMLGSMDIATLIQGALAITYFVGIIGMLSLIAYLCGTKDFGNIGKTIASIGAAMILMAFAVKILGGMDGGSLAKGLIAVTAFVGIIALLVAVVNSIEKDAPKIAGTLLAISLAIAILAGVAIVLGLIPTKNLVKGIAAVVALGAIMTAMIWATRGANDCKANLIVMTVAIGIMAVAIAALSVIDGKKLAGAVAALGTLMAIFALMTYATKYATTSATSLGAIIILTLVVAAIALVIKDLASLPVNNVLAVVAAISIMLLAMMGALAIASAIGPIAVGALVGLGLMVVVVFILSHIFKSLEDMSIGKMLAITASLSVMLLSMSAALLLASLMGPFAIAGAVALGIVTLVMFGIVKVIDIMNGMDLDASAKTTDILANFLGKMSKVMVVLGVAGLLAPFAIAATIAMIGVITSMTILMGLLGAISKNSNLQECVEKSIPLLQAIGVGLGSLVGGFIGGALSSFATGALVGIASGISLFWLTIQPFIIGVKNVDPAVTDGVKNLCKAFLALTGTSLVNKLTKFFTGGNDFTEIGAKLISFGIAMSVFSLTVKGINIKAVNASAKAAEGLAALMKNIPSTGGLWQKLAGEKDWSTITDGLVAFGVTLTTYGACVSLLTDEQISAISKSAEAGKALTDLQKEIPSSDGLWQKLAGKKDWSTLSSGLSKFGKALINYASSVTKLTDDKISAIKLSVEAGTALNELLEAMPRNGGKFQEWFGSKDWSTIGTGLGNFGQAMSDYYGKVKDVKTVVLRATVDAASTFNELSLDNNYSNLREFGKAIVDFGDSIHKYMESISDIDIGSLTTRSSNIAALAGQLGTTLVNKITNPFTEANSTIANTIDTFTLNMILALAAKNTSFSKEGSNLAESFAQGMAREAWNNGREIAKKMASDAADSAGSSDMYAKFGQVGVYLVDGFANGITAHTWKAQAEATAMARLAKEAAEKELGEHSPSKVFYKIGAFAGIGFINALDDYGDKSERASAEMAGSAIGGLKDSISKISNLIENGMDTQPTIRPIVDLTDVRSGVNAIDGMISRNRNIGFNVGGIARNAVGISKMMNNRQNGNGDVVDAVESLRNSVSNLKPGNTYSINGITYDDGSNVANAIETLVRAAKIERRV